MTARVSVCLQIKHRSRTKGVFGRCTENRHHTAVLGWVGKSKKCQAHLLTGTKGLRHL
jgi:hypothetical protein